MIVVNTIHYINPMHAEEVHPYAGTGLCFSITEITNTMRPARAIIMDSVVGSGSEVPTYTVRGSNSGMPAAHNKPIPIISAT